jgi:transcription-repair coupling factor (superfamily II helicase)
MKTILAPPRIRKQDNLLHWSGLFGSSRRLAISGAENDHLCLIIAEDLHQADIIKSELQLFNPDANVMLLPDWEVLPYDQFSPHDDIVSERIRILNNITTAKQGYLIASISTLLQRIAPEQHILGSSFDLKIHDRIEIKSFKTKVIQAGYRHVEQVWQHGEFSSRGAILDIFPMTCKEPIRIELLDDTIESLRYFNIETQRTSHKTEQFTLRPAHEYPLTEASITQFRQSWRDTFSGNANENPIYRNISQGNAAAGVEFFLPLFYHEMSDIFSYLPVSTHCYMMTDTNLAANKFMSEVTQRYEQLRYDIAYPILPPEKIYLSETEFFAKLKKYQQIKLHQGIANKSNHDFNCQALPDLSTSKGKKNGLEKLETFRQQWPGRIILCGETNGRTEILTELCASHNIQLKNYSSWLAAVESDDKISIITAPLDAGFAIANELAIITENELFQYHASSRKSKSSKFDPSTLIKDLIELKLGDAIVHRDYGIGRYQGLTTLTTGEITAEYLTLSYANEDKIYVPIASLHLINRYSGFDSDNAPLSKLGTTNWEKEKQKAEKRIRDVAAELLDLYSKRAAREGFAFSQPNADFTLFRNEFPFEETRDQAAAINAVIDDMTSNLPMDRLICGDVGFGKTEVAIQACFMATASNKQAAILAPTTLLANQHFQNFTNRFANWPIKIAVLSRLQPAKQQKETLTNLALGKIDIVIGTHKLLQKDILFRDLGLLVVDEEHRFGVRDKERIKKLRANIDILTLTATPIPRTLNMALSGARELSIIATPPRKRLSIKTFVRKHRDVIIKEAMLRETMRGGQVYLVHNDIRTMPNIKEKIEQLCPNLNIAIAHGQLKERELEQVMLNFHQQKIHILITTTIIESGIDIPTANTIIINRADKFGLAQLHQLRGRVGRSHHQAYAYLLIPENVKITSDAKKRLDAISMMEELGAGFNLATHDLEIRGAGELLGADQSGHINSIGYTLYMDMLNQAIQDLKNGQEPDFSMTKTKDTEVDLRVSCLLPESYIGDINTRLCLYKKLSSLATEEDIYEFKAELIDRFGFIPEETTNLLRATKLKLRCRQLGISKVEIQKNFSYIHFQAQPNIQPEKLIELIQNKPAQFRLTDNKTLRCANHDITLDEKLKIIDAVFADIEAK